MALIKMFICSSCETSKFYNYNSNPTEWLPRIAIQGRFCMQVDIKLSIKKTMVQIKQIISPTDAGVGAHYMTTSEASSRDQLKQPVSSPYLVRSSPFSLEPQNLPQAFTIM